MKGTSIRSISLHGIKLLLCLGITQDIPIINVWVNQSEITTSIATVFQAFLL